MKKITIIGTGYVGLVTGTCLAENGHEVICADIDENKIKQLNQNQSPIYEPGLEELIKKNTKAKRLKFTINIPQAIQESEIIFSCVGTPMGENHKADLKYVKEVAKTFANNLNNYKIFVNKSTVPVGTGDMVKSIIQELTSNEFDIVSNPEFLKEGSAVKDFLNPDRIVIGTQNDKAKEIMDDVYHAFTRNHSPIIFTDIKSAELIKYAANAMLATRISFMNEIANFCNLVGADVTQVAKGIGQDKRIGSRFLHAGIGYGGSCFPKDVAALIESGKEKKYQFQILKSVEEVNKNQKTIIVEKLKQKYQNLNNKTIAIWGLSFKPRTDDIREAPSIYIIKELLQLGAKIEAYDEIATPNFQKYHPELNITYHTNKYNATKNANILLVLTEWDEFRMLNFEKLKTLKDKLIIDGRNIYDPEKIENNNLEYIGIGKQNKKENKEQERKKETVKEEILI